MENNTMSDKKRNFRRLFIQIRKDNLIRIVKNNLNNTKGRCLP